MFGIPKQLLPGLLLVDSAPLEVFILLGRCPREIIPPRGDNLHYPPSSQAITVYCTMAGCLPRASKGVGYIT